MGFEMFSFTRSWGRRPLVLRKNINERESVSRVLCLICLPGVNLSGEGGLPLLSLPGKRPELDGARL